MKIHKAGGHHDIPSTILYQMALNASAYQWSKNLLNPLTPSYAFYQFEETFGYIEDTKWVVYSYNTETVINHSHPGRRGNGFTTFKRTVVYAKVVCAVSEVLID